MRPTYLPACATVPFLSRRFRVSDAQATHYLLPGRVGDLRAPSNATMLQWSIVFSITYVFQHVEQRSIRDMVNYPAHTFHAGQVSQVIKGASRRVVEVLRQPAHQSVYGPSCGLSVLLAFLRLSTPSKNKQNGHANEAGVNLEGGGGGRKKHTIIPNATGGLETRGRAGGGAGGGRHEPSLPPATRIDTATQTHMDTFFPTETGYFHRSA